MIFVSYISSGYIVLQMILICDPKMGSIRYFVKALWLMPLLSHSGDFSPVIIVDKSDVYVINIERFSKLS